MSRIKWHKNSNTDDGVYTNVGPYEIVVDREDRDLTVCICVGSDMVLNVKCRSVAEGKQRGLNYLVKQIDKIQDGVDKLWPHS